MLHSPLFLESWKACNFIDNFHELAEIPRWMEQWNECFSFRHCLACFHAEPRLEVYQTNIACGRTKKCDPFQRVKIAQTRKSSGKREKLLRLIASVVMVMWSRIAIMGMENACCFLLIFAWWMLKITLKNFYIRSELSAGAVKLFLRFLLTMIENWKKSMKPCRKNINLILMKLKFSNELLFGFSTDYFCSSLSLCWLRPS